MILATVSAWQRRAKLTRIEVGIQSAKSLLLAFCIVEERDPNSVYFAAAVVVALLFAKTGVFPEGEGVVALSSAVAPSLGA